MVGCGPELNRIEGAMELWVVGLEQPEPGVARIAFEDSVSEFDVVLEQPAFVASVPVGVVRVLVRTGERRSNRIEVEVFEGEVARVAVQLLSDLDDDADRDGVPARRDNCPFHGNASQRDTDRDGFGDACDGCQTRNDPAQADLDGDGIGDACDPDIDDDGVLNVADECPFDPSGDRDVDADGVCDTVDNCRVARNPEQDDCDRDGIGDACDEDIDDDSVPNGADICPFAPDPSQADADGDGVGDACEADPLRCAVEGGA